jgi:two-component sensor histidine kinase
MGLYNKKQWWKIILLLIAIIIGISSLYYTNLLVKKLSFEEKKKVELWANATKELGDASLSGKDFGFLLAVIQNNTTVPVILTDSGGNVISQRNLDSIKALDKNYVKAQLALMKKGGKFIKIDIADNNCNYIYYTDSYLLQQLTYYPYIQLGVILLFIFVAYLAFSSSRKAEQNKVWVGLTKETAHQLGTPTSSLLAWTELLKEKVPEKELVYELEKDVNRLEIITDRFSKIGSKPTLKNVELIAVINSAIKYLKSRTSEKIEFKIESDASSINIPLSQSLFEWVIENLCKNAVDAIQEQGIISISIKHIKNKVVIDITDTGKGIPKSKYKTVFKPGFTTKARGWGLGLSLAKRIIENYHNGKIFVLSSELNKGTTFRILLKNER